MKKDRWLLPMYLLPYAYLELIWEVNGYPYGLLILFILFAVLAFFHRSIMMLLIGHLLAFLSSECFFTVFGLEETSDFMPYRVWEMPKVIHFFTTPLIVIVFYVFYLKRALQNHLSKNNS